MELTYNSSDIQKLSQDILDAIDVYNVIDNHQLQVPVDRVIDFVHTVFSHNGYEFIGEYNE